MNIENLNEQLTLILNEYTEEPDAFETESERQMQQELEQQIDMDLTQAEKDRKAQYYKERAAGINSIWKFINKLKETRDVKKIKNGTLYEISFWIPTHAFNKFSEWNDKQDNILKKCHLKMERENASEGCYVHIR